MQLSLVASNRYDSYEVIKFFDPGKEAFIEYEITKIVYSLLGLKKPKVGVITPLPMFGGYNFTKNELIFCKIITAKHR